MNAIVVPAKGPLSPTWQEGKIKKLGRFVIVEILQNF